MDNQNLFHQFEKDTSNRDGFSFSPTPKKVMPRTRFSGGDVNEAILLIFLSLVAWILPERFWLPVCYALAKIRPQKKASRLKRHAQLRSVFREMHESGLESISKGMEQRKYEMRLQTLRSYAPWGWEPLIDIEGIEHVRNALANSNGAVLWVSHFVFHGLVAKMGLSKAGFGLYHVSRPEHGFSKTSFGIRFLNPIRTSIEDRYLEKRIVIDQNKRLSALRQARLALSRNKLVTITVGPWESRRLIEAPFGSAKILFATGVITLASSTGAPLLPVIPVWNEATRSFKLKIYAPLPTQNSNRKEEMMVTVVQHYLSILARYVIQYPDQWRGWGRLMV